jgi:alkanesulfonate monooxygenase SsuD/methylene tetrahydromethanopterin reductase-like flavin-dependent oxidoreductase (luciferase family)
MHFDLFYELSVPAFLPRNEAQVFQESLDELAFADRLRFRTAWLVEHHFMPEYSHSAAPDLFLAAASQRTRRLRLGHGIIPLPYHHPLQVAERVATLDILAQGRTEFGFGRGFSPQEYAAFGQRMEDSRSYTDEALRVILAAWQQSRLTFHGTHFEFDDLPVIPRPVQSPHPPLWTAAVSPESFELAARLGVGVLAGPFKPWFMVREDIRLYRQAWAAAGWDRATDADPRVGMTVGIFCHEDGRRARSMAKEGLVWFYQRLLGQTRPILEKLYAGYEYYRRFGAFSGLLTHTVSLPVLEQLGMVVVGTPAQCRERLERLAAGGVDHVLCAVGAGVMPTAAVQESMALLDGEVIPALETEPA